MDDLLIILVVEDELLIQHIAEATLDDGGFKVDIAASAEDALQLLDDESRRYRALVTDINLGHGPLSGWDVARRGREVNPELPVVYMTGDSAAEWAAQGVPNSVLLTKPFAPAQLLTAVSQLLNASGPIVS